MKVDSFCCCNEGICLCFSSRAKSVGTRTQLCLTTLRISNDSKELPLNCKSLVRTLAYLCFGPETDDVEELAIWSGGGG